MPRPTPARPQALDAAVWRKSSHSQGSTGNCVELARIPGVLAIRDSKNPHGPVLALTPHAAHRAATAIKHGNYDL